MPLLQCCGPATLTSRSLARWCTQLMATARVRRRSGWSGPWARHIKTSLSLQGIRTQGFLSFICAYHYHAAFSPEHRLPPQFRHRRPQHSKPGPKPVDPRLGSNRPPAFGSSRQEDDPGWGRCSVTCGCPPPDPPTQHAQPKGLATACNGVITAYL